MTILVGSNVTTSYTDTANSSYHHVGGADLRIYWREWTASDTGSVTTLGLYMQDMSWASSSIKLLIANSTGTVLAATSAILMSGTTAGWVTASIASTAVTNGQTYRLGFTNNCTGSAYSYVYGHATDTGADYDNTGNTFTNDPPASTIAADGAAGSYAKFLMYADGTAGGSSAPRASFYSMLRRNS